MSKVPQTIINIFLVLGLSIYSVTLFNFPIYSNEVAILEDEISQKEQEIKEKESILSSVENRIKAISNSNYSISQKIVLLNEEIAKLEENITNTEVEINAKVVAIEEKRVQLEGMKVLIDEVLGDLYMQSRYKLSNFFLNKDNWKDLVESIYIKKSTISMLRFEVEKIGGEFSSLAESKADLDKQMADLDSQRKGLDDAHVLLANEKIKLQAELSKQVAAKSNIKSQIGGISKEISQLQQTLLYLRGGGDLSSTNIPSSNAESTTQLSYFLSNAPSGTFGVFSFGANTHRNGMSQWGAWERAQQGQSYQDILSFYYGGATIKTDLVTTSGYGTEGLTPTIEVNGYGPIDLESNYMLGIHEIDPRFNKDNVLDMNNLKAQAIAARTFAINYTNNGRKPICATTFCQVYNTDFYGGAWAKAVAETKGMTLANTSGNIFSSQFSAVTGGWINGVGYDLKPGSAGWTERAWEGLSGVSWFHKIWYQRTYSNGTKVACSTHPNPWMTGEELADVLNAYLYLINNTSASIDPRLYSYDYGTCWGGSVNPYSSAELKSLISNPVSNVIGAQTINNDGWTRTINFTAKLENGGTSVISIIGSGSPTDNVSIFRDAFNLRAPGSLSIPQKCSGCVGFTHINIVKK